RALHLWDSTTGSLIQRFEPHSDYVRNCAFAADRDRFFSSAEATLYVRDRRNPGEPEKRKLHRNLISDFHISNDGARILSSSEDGTLALSDAGTGKKVAVLLHLKVALKSSAVAPDWSCVATGDDKGRLRIIRLSDGELVADLQAHS